MIEDLFKQGHIRTFTGIYVDVLNPTLDMICIEDIAHSLSMQCRFGGHLKQRYSVAQHSLHVCYLVPPSHKLQGLLHDASEAYLLDLPSPVKALFPEYRALEEKYMQLIAEKFSFDWPKTSLVDSADLQALNFEWHEYMLRDGGSWAVMAPHKAEHSFLETFKTLC